MGRNLDGRVEIVTPVLDPVIAEAIDGQILAVLFADNVRSRELLESGSYRRRVPGPGEIPIDAQRVFLTQAPSHGLTRSIQTLTTEPVRARSSIRAA